MHAFIGGIEFSKPILPLPSCSPKKKEGGDIRKVPSCPSPPSEESRGESRKCISMVYMLCMAGAER